LLKNLWVLRLNNLALVYGTIGQYDEALELSLEALEKAEKTLGKDHPDYATMLNNLALVYQKTGQYCFAAFFGGT